MICCCAEERENTQLSDFEKQAITPDLEKGKLEPEYDDAELSTEPGAPITGLQLEFIVDGMYGITKDVQIKSAPLGLSFTTQKPLAVKKVMANGSGAKAGVQPGWIFSKIDGESLDNLDYDESRAVLLKGVNKLPKDSDLMKTEDTLVFEFLSLSSMTLQTVSFNHRPLQFTFTRDVPMIVKSVTPGGNADTLGVQLGWEVKTLGGVDIKDVDFEDVIANWK